MGTCCLFMPLFFIDAYRNIDNESKLQNIDRRGLAWIPLPAIWVHYSKQENGFHRRRDPRNVLVSKIKSATLSNTTGEICINMKSKALVFHLYHSHPFSKYYALVGAFWKKFTSGLYISIFQNIYTPITQCWNLSYLTVLSKCPEIKISRGYHQSSTIEVLKKIDTCVVSFHGLVHHSKLHLITRPKLPHTWPKECSTTQENDLLRLPQWKRRGGFFHWPQGKVSKLRSC